MNALKKCYLDCMLSDVRYALGVVLQNRFASHFSKTLPLRALAKFKSPHSTKVNIKSFNIFSRSVSKSLILKSQRIPIRCQQGEFHGFDLREITNNPDK
jgi:hypothetical protein